MDTINAGGAEIPVLGFGTYRVAPQEVTRIVPYALEAGFRHFDTAQIYGNEAALGGVLRRAHVDRSELFVTTKIWPSNYGTGRFVASLTESLDKLGMDYVDLLLLHWPSDTVPLEVQVAGLDEARASGRARHVGVSNFTIGLVDAVVQLAAYPIVTNQVEIHPFIDQRRLLAALHRLGIAATAYHVMADGQVMLDPAIRGIAAAHGKSPAQVVLRWIIQQGVVALSKTVTPDRLAENLDVFNFALAEDEMRALSALARPNGRLANPRGLAPVWDE